MNPARTLELIWSNLAKLGPRRLAALCVVGITLFGAIAAGSYLLSRADYQVLYIGLTPQDSSRIATVLSDLGIPFDSATDGTRVSVPANVLARARALLEGRDPDKAASKPVADAAGRFIVQIGAFEDTARAQEVRQKVERGGLKTYTHVAETPSGKRTRVRVGPYGSRADAEKAASRIKALGLPAAILTL